MSILFGRDQLPVVISFFICGIISGAFYDILRIKRRLFSDRLVFLFVDDLLFFIFCTMLVIFNAYSFNDGNMKWYEIPLMISGFAIYRKTLSVFFTGICFYIIDCIKRLANCIVRPIKKFCWHLIGLFMKLVETLFLILYVMRKKQEFESWRLNGKG